MAAETETVQKKTQVRQTPQVRNLDDLLFERRNRAYGAYTLRKSYNRYVAIAMGSTALLMMMLIAYPYIRDWFLGKGDVVEKHVIVERNVVLEELPPPPTNEPPPPPIDVPPPIKEVKFTPPKLEKERVDDEPPPKMEDVAHQNVSTKDVEGEDRRMDPNESSPPPPPPPPDPEPKIFDIVDEQPEFPGGYAGYLQWLKSKMEYPEFAKDNGIKGRVLLQIIVDKDGSVRVDKVLSSPHDVLTKEAIRVINKSPKWTPGKINGAPVPSRYPVKIDFQLTTAR